MEFPVVCSEESLKNKAFANGYDAHVRIKKCMLAIDLMNQAIGTEMLLAISKIGNKYAMTFLQATVSATK